MLTVEIGQVISVTVIDESLNINNSETILKDLKSITAANSGKDITLNFTNVLSIDSSAIAMLVSFVQLLAGSRRKLSIINARGSIRNTIKVLNLSTFLNIK